jgi:ankyrin repeat protein
LVAYGADSDIIDNNGQTPLFYAIKGGKIDVIDYLLRNGANAKNTDKKGLTPIALAKKQNK